MRKRAPDKTHEEPLPADPDGSLTTRGQRIIEHTPMRRFGDSEDLAGAVLWLVSAASRFVIGFVTPVDGGFSAYCGAAPSA